MDIGNRVELQADRMSGATEAMAFTDSYKHMECLSSMRLQFFLICLPMQRRVPQLVIYVSNVFVWAVNIW